MRRITSGGQQLQVGRAAEQMRRRWEGRGQRVAEGVGRMVRQLHLRRRQGGRRMLVVLVKIGVRLVLLLLLLL